MANLENQIKAAMERVFPARQQSAAGDSQQRETLPATQADRVFRAYQLRTPQRRQREDLPSLDQAKKAYQKALQEHRKARKAVEQALSQAGQRAAQAKEKARADQAEALAQVEALEKDLARLLDEGGEDRQGIELESRIGFYRRKASHAQQVQEEKPALLPQELAQLRAALEKEREAAARLSHAQQDLEDALGQQLELLLQAWPQQWDLSPRSLPVGVPIVRNTFPEIQQNAGACVQAILNSGTSGA